MANHQVLQRLVGSPVWGPSTRKDFFGGSTSKSEPADLISPEFAALRGPFAEALLSFLGVSGPVTGTVDRPGPDPDDVTLNPTGGGIPGLTPDQYMPAGIRTGGGERQMLARLRTPALAGEQRTNYLNRTLRGDFLQEPGQEETNPYLDAMIKAAQRPTLEGLEETLSRTLPGRFTQAGQFIQPGGSSPFDRAAAIASRGAANAIGDIATNLSGTAYETERQRQFARQEAERGRQQESVQLGQAEVDTTIKNLQAQALPRMIREAGIERGLAEFNRRQDLLLKILGLIGGVSAGVPVTFGESETSPNIFGTLFPSGITSSGSVLS